MLWQSLHRKRTENCRWQLPAARTGASGGGDQCNGGHVELSVGSQPLNFPFLAAFGDCAEASAEVEAQSSRMLIARHVGKVHMQAIQAR